MSSPIAVLGNQYTQALTAIAGAERVFALLDLEPLWHDDPAAEPLSRIEGAIEFRNVSFAYEPGRPVLREIDLTVKPGQTVALVGQSGCGKTTLLGLLAKLQLPAAGTISIDGRDLRLLREDSLRGLQ